MLRIITFRDSEAGILYRPTKNILVFDKKLKAIAQDMEKTLLQNDGLGLAAPQIGESLSLCVIRNGKTVETYCNPDISERSEEKERMEEGCLSFPNVFLDITRSKSVTVNYQDLAGKRKKTNATGLLARTLQHEIDHLNGVAFIERS